jgi:hypothetical protein
MEIKNRVIATVGILVVLVIVFYLITSTITNTTGYFVFSDAVEKDKEFIECLNEKEVSLYINSKDIDLSLEKIKAKDFLEGVNIFNCYRNNLFCVEQGVGVFPSWIIEKQKINRDITIYELADLSGCDLR